MDQPKLTVGLQTELIARFIVTDAEGKPLPDQSQVEALNIHAEAIAERLQPVFRTLVIDMLDLIKPMYTTSQEESTDEKP